MKASSAAPSESDYSSDDEAPPAKKPVLKASSAAASESDYSSDDEAPPAKKPALKASSAASSRPIKSNVSIVGVKARQN